LAGTHADWLGVTDGEKAKVEEQIAFAGTLNAALNKNETKKKTFAVSRSCDQA
jgi:hypothetical protein